MFEKTLYNFYYIETLHQVHLWTGNIQIFCGGCSVNPLILFSIDRNMFCRLKLEIALAIREWKEWKFIEKKYVGSPISRYADTTK